MTTNKISATVTASIVNSLPADVRNHITNTNNPHNITCEQINAFPNQEGVVIDNNYVHTDNNFTTEEKNAVNNLMANQESLDNLGEFSTKLEEFTTQIENQQTDMETNYVKFSDFDNTTSATYLKSDSAPTTETVASFIGQIYLDTTNNKTYQCTAIDKETPSYTWVQIIKETDIASNSNFGVIRTRSNSGVFVNNGYLYISPPTDLELREKTSTYKAVTLEQLDKAVKSGLAESSLEWTDYEKSSATNLIGATAFQSGKGSPSSSTVDSTYVKVGDLYLDTTTNELYHCYERTSSLEGYDSKWKKVAIKVVNKNILINPDFKINQREKTSYSTYIIRLYTVDRWMKDKNSIIEITDGVYTFANASTTEMNGVLQFIPDNSQLLGNKVTFAVKFVGNDTVYTLTSDVLPSDVSSIAVDSVIKTVTTDFGALQLEFGKTNFMVRILANCPTDTENLTYLTPEWAKLEIGDEFTGYEAVNKYEELEKCYPFYQKVPNETMPQPGYLLYTEALTTMAINCTLYRALYKTPSVKYSDTTMTYFLDNGQSIEKTFNDFTLRTYSPDNRMLLIEFGCMEDNTEMLNGQTELYRLCWAKLNEFELEAEIKK